MTTNSAFPELPVEFGLFDWVESSGHTNGQIFEHKLRLAEIADRLGFFGWHVAEHQGTPLSVDGSPSVLIAAAIQRTKQLRLGALTWCLPWYSPFRFYNEICMLDQMSGGRVELGVGRGVSPFESKYYGLNTIDDSRSRYRETLDIFFEACRSDVLNYQGQHYSYNDVELYSKPVQQPYPPLWFPSSDNSSITFTAEHGYHTAINTCPPDQLRDLMALYRQVWVEHQGDPGRHNGHVAAPRLGTTKHVVVADTDAEAEALCRSAHQVWASHIGHLPRRMAAQNVADPRPGHERRVADRNDYEARERDGFVVTGAPQTVADKLVEQIKAATVNYVMFVVSFGDMEHGVAERSLTLLGEQVIPAVRKALAAPAAR